jgi:hypothetical protein
MNGYPVSPYVDEFGMPIVPQQMGYLENTYGVPAQYPKRKTTKRDIIEWLKYTYQPSELVQVDDFGSSNVARHICPNAKMISRLPKQLISVPLMSEGGVIGVESFICGYCRKMLINSQSLDFYQ